MLNFQQNSFHHYVMPCTSNDHHFFKSSQFKINICFLVSAMLRNNIFNLTISYFGLKIILKLTLDSYCWMKFEVYGNIFRSNEHPRVISDIKVKVIWWWRSLLNLRLHGFSVSSLFRLVCLYVLFMLMPVSN